ncbi:hypothetical protein NUU61_008891 [Penicillium alfredii]|uniref:Uncharacterized protein n=1 Tax=Penicillium alfredii TaxID=1506179 RepID=A0A9W9EM01_9EURO|nr:uncharacterized protein NUU61_008891 [Penicillium alfredii]KAJ5084312.1 hypothetical protein NUU61_008891 [Penicillium alfredii]
MPETDPPDFDISQALADIAKYVPLNDLTCFPYLTSYFVRGETAASALENHLDVLEGKVDELVALFEEKGPTAQETIPADKDTGDSQTESRTTS